MLAAGTRDSAGVRVGGPGALSGSLAASLRPSCDSVMIMMISPAAAARRRRPPGGSDRDTPSPAADRPQSRGPTGPAGTVTVTDSESEPAPAGGRRSARWRGAAGSAVTVTVPGDPPGHWHASVKYGPGEALTQLDRTRVSPSPSSLSHGHGIAAGPGLLHDSDDSQLSDLSDHRVHRDYGPPLRVSPG